MKLNEKSGIMMVRGTPPEIEVITGMIQVPPGGVVAYMRWLGESVKAESTH
ncbi:MAG: hypothetical protein HY299_12395 [Verrucomicrobia bacterium]|nr:hypothetical protein [Verrucomicrobiota bacterium]